MLNLLPKYSRDKLRLSTGLTLALFLTTSVLAKDWQVSGFITQGLTHSSDYDYLGETDDSISTDFTEAALNLSLQHSDKIRLSTQGAYRNSNAIDREEFFLDLLQVDAQLYSKNNTTAGVKLGRFKMSYGLYNGAIDVPAVWPTALISDIAFFSSYRSGAISMDGLEVYWQREIDDWSLGIVAQTGDEVSDSNIYRAFFYSEESKAKYIGNDDNYTLRVNLASPDNSLLVGWDYWHIATDVDVFIPEQIINRTTQTYREQRVYLQKHWSNWQLDSEYIWGKFYYDSHEIIYPNGVAGCTELCQNNLDVYFSPQQDIQDYYAAYINIYRHYANGLSLYGGYGEQYDYKSDKNGKQLAQDFGVPGHIAYMKQTLFGFRYVIDQHWNMAAMVSLFEGTANLEFISNPPAERKHKYWQVFHINLSYVF